MDLMLRRRMLMSMRSGASSVTGYLVSFEAAAAAPLNGLLINIEPLRSGVGDPGAGNIRTLTGWTAAKLYNDENLWFPLSDSDMVLNTALNGTAGATASSNYYKTSKFIPCAYLSGQRVTTNWVRSTGGVNNPAWAFYSDADASACVGTSAKAAAASTTQTMNIPDTARYVRICINKSTSIANKYAVLGDTVPETVPPVATPTVIDWSEVAGTVYAGTLDVLTGVLTVRPYYASYAGEPLVGPWLSDRDVYAPNVTPTTGAQVVDLGGVAATYQLTGQQISSVVGANHFWTDAGQVTVTTP